MADPRLEQYIETIRRRLRGLTPARRDEELQEIRQHLDALVAGHRQTGFGEDEAVDLAIRQFGHAEQVGHALRQSWQPQGLREIVPAVLIYVVSVVVILVFFVTANDKPSDFPHEWSDKLVLALILPAGVMVHAMLSYVRTRRRRA